MNKTFFNVVAATFKLIFSLVLSTIAIGAVIGALFVPVIIAGLYLVWWLALIVIMLWISFYFMLMSALSDIIRETKARSLLKEIKGIRGLNEILSEMDDETKKPKRKRV